MLIRKTLAYSWARGLPGLVNFLALALYTRLVAPGEYGRYVLTLAAVGVANTVLFQWLRLGLLRLLAAYDGNRESFLSTVSTIYLGLFLLTGVVGATTVLLWTDPISRGFVALGFVLLWSQAGYEVNLELAVAGLRPGRFGVLALSRAVLSVSFGGVLAILGYGAVGLLCGAIAGFLLPSTISLVTDWSRVRPTLARLHIMKELLAYGLPLVAVLGLSTLIGTSDRLLLGWMRGSDSAGLYAAGYDLAQQSLGTLMMVVNLAAFPLAVQALERRGSRAARHQLERHAVLLAAIALPASFGLAALAPDLTGVLLGQPFRASAAALVPIIAIAALLAGFRSFYFDLSFQLGRATTGQIAVLLPAAAINLVLNLILIPPLGPNGAAVATLTAYAVALVLSGWRGRRVFPVPLPLRQWVRIFFAALTMAVVMRVLPGRPDLVTLIGRASLGIVVYGVLLLFLDVGNCTSVASRLLARKNPKR